MITTVYEVKPGERFTVYEQEYIKIDRDSGEGWHLSFCKDRAAPHGFALQISGGVIVEFPVNARCEVESERSIGKASAVPRRETVPAGSDLDEVLGGYPDDE